MSHIDEIALLQVQLADAQAQIEALNYILDDRDQDIEDLKQEIRDLTYEKQWKPNSKKVLEDE